MSILESQSRFKKKERWYKNSIEFWWQRTIPPSIKRVVHRHYAKCKCISPYLTFLLVLYSFMSFGFSYYIPFCLLFQPGGRESKTVPMSPDGEGEDAESPMPHPSQFGGKEKRRGAVSAEPITEDDICAYVKKVFNVIYIRSHLLRRHIALVKRIRPHWLCNSCKKAFH